MTIGGVCVFLFRCRARARALFHSQFVTAVHFCRWILLDLLNEAVIILFQRCFFSTHSLYISILHEWAWGWQAKMRQHHQSTPIKRTTPNRNPPRQRTQKHAAAVMASLFSRPSGWRERKNVCFFCAVNFLTRFQTAAYFYSKRINLNPLRVFFIHSFELLLLLLLTTSVDILQWQLITVRPTVSLSFFSQPRKNRNFEQKIQIVWGRKKKITRERFGVAQKKII